MMRVLKITGWVAMALAASLIALTAARYFFLSPDVAIGPPLAQKFAASLSPLLFHAGGGLIALLIGAWGFWTAFRNKYLNLHRWLGRIYLLAVAVGGLAGLFLAQRAFGGLPTRLGFSMLAILWLSTGAMAYRRIRQGRIQIHREWMIRNYALTFSAVTLRVWLPLFMALGYEFPEAYTTVAWLCWIPNLLVAELIIGSGRARLNRRQAMPSLARG